MSDACPTWERPLPISPLNAAELERFWRAVDRRGDTECWTWKLALSRGYGALALKREGRWTQPKAHRIAYELLVGPIPDGLQLDHLCRVRHCVNPAHLEPVTNRENGLRGESACAENARKTHCPRGHEYTPANTYMKTTRYGTDGRECWTCAKALARARNIANLGGVDFPCDECPASFGEPRFLSMHKTKVHDAGSSRDRVLKALIAAGEAGLTEDELAPLVERTRRTVGVARLELERDGLVARRLIVDPATLTLIGDRRPAPSGAMAAVWCLATYSKPAQEIRGCAPGDPPDPPGTVGTWT